jgi:hypothetical protein
MFQDTRYYLDDLTTKCRNYDSLNEVGVRKSSTIFYKWNIRKDKCH